MFFDRNVILGLPIENLNADEVVDRIYCMIEDYRLDNTPKHVVTVNVDFFVNTMGWMPGNIKHPELLEILRRADLLTPDGMPIVWASRLLGKRLKERVTGADLVPKIAEMAEKHQVSLFLLGGGGNVGEMASKKLKELFPNLKIKGELAPFVHIEGNELSNSELEDQKVVDHINNSCADILLIAFGNPKQELWFARNRYRLKIPVSIGVGGTFEFIAGTVPRAPMIMQRLGFEWCYRLLKEPKRLWKRYLVGLFKFSFMILPVLIYQAYRGLLTNVSLILNKGYKIAQAELKESNPKKVKIVQLPSIVNFQVLDQLKREITEVLNHNGNIYLDSKNVSFMDTSALGFLTDLLDKAHKMGKLVFMVETNSYIRRFLRFNRVWDKFEGICFENDRAFVSNSKVEENPNAFHYELREENGYALLTIFGRLDASEISKCDINLIIEKIGKRDCILNLKELLLVDSSGLIFFLKLQRNLISVGKNIVICSLKENVKQMFKLCSLNRFFNISPDINSAKRNLEASR